MLSRLFRSRDRAPAKRHTIPEGQRVYAVGDIHGCLDLLDDLIGRIEADDRARGPARTTVIFLGDLIDRGPDSAGVLSRLSRFAGSRADVRILLGNHEEIFLQTLGGDPKAAKLFCRIGGRETAISYGIDPTAYERLDYDELVEHLDRLVPSAHKTFLEGFEDMITIGDYTFVHAGVRPDTPLNEQRTMDLRWIRDPFLDHRAPLDRMIVHGHTMTEDVAMLPHRIGVDTGAYASGRLSALGLEGGDTWVLQADRRTSDGGSS